LFLPQLSALLISITAFPAALALKPGFEGFAAGILHGLVALLVLSIFKALLQRVRMPILYASFSVVIAFVLVEVVVLGLAQVIRIPFSELETRNILMFGVVFGVSLAIGQAVQTARGEAVAELKTVIAATELLVSRLRQEIWLNNRKMASVLHGPVQTALYAASMKLSSAKAITADLVNEAENDISAALERLDLAVGEQEEFSEIINQIVSLWRGSCEITVFIEDSASTALRNDKNAGACVVEVVQEAIANAIKHGRASNASVMIYRTERNTAEVRVRNDGTPLEVQKLGFGSQLLDDICHTWDVRDDGRGVLLTAEIALA
jgi:signal transduction histidine kinase